MEVYLARQPIFTSKKKIFGYELLFRNGLENVFPNVDGDLATSNLMANIFFPFDFKEILGGKPAFINFTEKLIIDRVPLLLPSEHFIIEVLENIKPEKPVLSALSMLAEKGFTIALDDFIYHNKFEPMIALSKIIKFDVTITPLNELYETIKNIKSNHTITLLAEKIETYDEFNQAKKMGFDLFQGYFFSKPQLLSTKGISSFQTTKLKLVKEFSRKELVLERIEALIKKDAALSFKLLKFINSAYFYRANPINTIKDAITYLGTNELRKFIHIVVISDLSTQKPNELVRTSIIRATMCEKCGGVFDTEFSTDELFTLGLFSLMDAILDCKMKDILQHIVLSKKMKTALIGKNKNFNIILKIIEGFEKGDWENIVFDVIAGKSIEKKLPEFYLDSVKMAHSFF
jgi:c-di-GMP-related signal transduction protein